MKKMISLLSVFVIMFTMTVSVFAGSIPEDLLSDDEAKLYVGRIEDFTDEETPSAPYVKVTSVSITPVEKIKGDVEVGKTIDYDYTNMHLKLEKGKEYLIADIDENNLYAYEIEYKTEKEIKLVDSRKYDMVQRLENYLNEGAYARAEQERSDIGNQISFAEFLFAKPLSDSNVKKVIFRVQDEICEVAFDEFEKVAKEIMITNVKNEALHDEKAKPEQPDPYKTNLYIELQDGNEQLVSYAAVSRHGEVDKYGLMMSRLMTKDYEMKKDDLSKLYSLLPDEVQKKINAPNGVIIDDEAVAHEIAYIPIHIQNIFVIWILPLLIGMLIRLVFVKWRKGYILSGVFALISIAVWVWTKILVTRGVDGTVMLLAWMTTMLFIGALIAGGISLLIKKLKD